jgi:hypothetical protein
MQKKMENLGLLLSRGAQKKIVGALKNFESGGGYKCCWDHDRANCSICVPAAYPSCSHGAHAVEC